MNCKEKMREQNDISIIIGNLPKRLQKKIAEEVGVTAAEFGQTGLVAVVDSNKDNAKVASVKHVATTEPNNQEHLPGIDFFLRMSSTNNAPTVLEASGQAATANVLKTEATAIPGILRLNIAETAKMTRSTTQKRHVRGNSHLKRTEDSAVAEELLQMSPARQLYKVTGQPPVWFDQLADVPHIKELPQLYENMRMLMQRNIVLENWETFCETRVELQQIFVQLLLHQLKFCCEQKVDTFFWKLLFYNTREYLKAQQSKEAAAQQHVLTLIDDGLRFYADAYAQVVNKYFPDTHARTAHKFEFIAKVAAQKLLICSGDLSRYKAKQLQTSDYSEAAQYYQRAQRLIPTNGIPYNQLAIVAIHARKKFDAIYFHMRSLMSSNAIYSARESLLVLFDEIRKKYEETELKTSPVHRHHSPHGSNNSGKSMRKEVWIYPDGVRRLHRTDINGNNATINDENRLSEMSVDELLRRFTSLYLYVIGKLYTGIGMESIQDNQKKLLIQLNDLLKRSNGLLLTRSRMLKMVALNIFVLDHNIHSETRREIRYHAFNICNQMFGLLLHKCNQLFTAYTTRDISVAFNDKCFADLNTLLQFIKIYADWLMKNVYIWEPIRIEEHSFIDCWAEMQRLFEHITHLQTLQINNDADTQQIVLEEDNFLLGFTPLTTTTDAALTKQLSQTDCNSTPSAQFHVRIKKIANFEKCYLKNQQRLEKPEESHFILEDLGVAIKTALEQLQSDDAENEYTYNNENIVVNGLHRSNSGNDIKLINSNVAAENAQVSQLTKLKKELAAKSNVKQMYNNKLEQILKLVDSKLYIEVRPKFLLPDTNCFIDCLEDFELLATEFKRYTLIIPLTVVKELDGLSKGVKLETYEKSLQKHRIHHFDDVSTRAKKSLEFIKTSKNSVKCATTKGSIINASLFALVEEEHVSNDDKILATALALSKTMSTETSKDGKCLIQTELVLITTDRNLRVKALSRNLAVSELSEFLQWAKDCNN